MLQGGEGHAIESQGRHERRGYSITACVPFARAFAGASLGAAVACHSSMVCNNVHMFGEVPRSDCATLAIPSTPPTNRGGRFYEFPSATRVEIVTFVRLYSSKSLPRVFQMSDTATQLLATFQSLPPQEQHELLVMMLRHSGDLPDTIVTDDQLAALADELFQTLDAEESHGDDAEAG